MTTKKTLNDLVKRVADLTDMENNRAAAIAAGKESYLMLDEGFDHYYELQENTIPNGTRLQPFYLGHHRYKAGEMATMLRGLIAGLTHACNVANTKQIVKSI